MSGESVTNEPESTGKESASTGNEIRASSEEDTEIGDGCQG